MSARVYRNSGMSTRLSTQVQGYVPGNMPGIQKVLHKCPWEKWMNEHWSFTHLDWAGSHDNIHTFISLVFFFSIASMHSLLKADLSVFCWELMHVHGHRIQGAWIMTFRTGIHWFMYTIIWKARTCPASLSN